MLNHNLLQQVTLPTRVTDTNETLIDHVYTRSNKTLQTDVIVCDISDHYPTLTKYINEKAPTKEQKITKRWFKEESYDDIKDALEDKEDTWQLMHDLTLDEATNLLHKTIQDILDEIAPIETKTMSNKPINRWLTSGIKISLHNAEKQYKKVKQGKLQKSEYKKYKKILESCIRRLKHRHYTNLIGVAGADSRKLWSIMNEVIDRKQTKHMFPSDFVDKGKTISGDKNIANSFNNYFTSIGEDMANSIPNTDGFEKHLTHFRHLSFQLEPLLEEDVEAILKGQQPKLSCGIDTINNKLVTKCYKELTEPMTIIINKSIAEGKVPAIHKKARIIPLYKKGQSNVFGNYRPVSLLPSLSKILEKAICKQLTHYLEKYNILCPNQFGFRAKNQTTHVVHSMLNTIASNAINNQCTIAAYIDLSKAFDCLQYDKLFKKMECIGFDERTLSWFKSYLSDREQCVDVNGTISDWQTVKLGVPQGSILGPILFLIYVNDINNCETAADFKKFADDTTILTTGASLQEAANNMNTVLAKVNIWFKQNKLNLNPSKTRCMIFNAKTEETNLITIDNTTIERVWEKGKETSFKLVGIHVDEKLKWDYHINKINNKIASAIYGLTKCSKELSSENKKLLYSGLIHSHITYGLPIWGLATQGRLDKILVKQKKAIRKVFNLKYRDHTLPFFFKGNILQLNELITHTILCYIQSGLSEHSPPNVKRLWNIKTQNRTDLRDKGIILDFPVCSKHSINQLPLVAHAKIWNNQGKEKYVKELKPFTYKSQSKQSLLGSYLTTMSPEERDIALKPMKKAKNQDAEDNPEEDVPGQARTTDPNNGPEEEEPTSQTEKQT